MPQTVKALAAHEAGGSLEPYEFELGEVGSHQVDIDVTACGVCHSDLSMLENDWGMSQYPLVPGHEVVGTIAAKGDHVDHLKVGQKVGLGWFSRSCMRCRQCMGGDHNMCEDVESTIVGRHGGFANRVRCDGAWAVPIPDGVDAKTAGPLFCGGITVFNPIVQLGISPTDRVGVIGIGGLGHLALKFLNAWGCEVTAFTSSADKKSDEAKQMGAHRVVDSTSDDALQGEAGRFDLILNTANANLNWKAFLNALGPRGALHSVGAVPDPMEVEIFDLLLKQRQLSSSPLGSPATLQDMLEFCGRHGIAPVTESFKMSEANEALRHLKDGKARYRIVLEQDLG